MTEPTWMLHARALIDTKEVRGPASNPTILGWAAFVGNATLGIAYNADGVPWCGLFVANCVKRAGLKPAPIAVRAKAWASWEANLGPSVLCPGAVLVFERQGGGHVGFYAGEDPTHYHVLGGNQSDAVNIMRIAKGRCIARRWPRGISVIGKPVHLASNGAPVSVSEA